MYKALNTEQIKRIILFIILCYICINCYADDWTSIGKGSHSDIFIQKNSIKDVEEYRQAWILYSYDVIRIHKKKKYHSVVFLEKFDCKNKMISPKKIIFYEKKMAQGKFVNTIAFDNDNFKPLIPNTIRETKLSYICSYKIKK